LGQQKIKSKAYQASQQNKPDYQGRHSQHAAFLAISNGTRELLSSSSCHMEPWAWRTSHVILKQILSKHGTA
jgi:hypothetical protein